MILLNLYQQMFVIGRGKYQVIIDKNIYQLVLKGQQLYAKKQYNDCVKIFKKVIQANPLLGAGYISLANAYFCLKENQNAIVSYQKALTLHIQQKSEQNCLVNLTQVYLLALNYEKVIEVCKKGIKKFPKQPVFYKNIGKAYIQLKNFILAQQYFKDSIKINPIKQNCFLELIQLYKLTQDYEKAYQIFQENLPYITKGSIYFASVILAQICNNLKKYEQAIQVCLEGAQNFIIGTNIHNIKILTNAVYAYIKLDKINEIYPLYINFKTKFQQYNPHLQLRYNDIFQLQQNSFKQKEALEFLQKVYEFIEYYNLKTQKLEELQIFQLVKNQISKNKILIKQEISQFFCEFIYPIVGKMQTKQIFNIQKYQQQYQKLILSIDLRVEKLQNMVEQIINKIRADQSSEQEIEIVQVQKENKQQKKKKKYKKKNKKKLQERDNQLKIDPQEKKIFQNQKQEQEKGGVKTIMQQIEEKKCQLQKTMKIDNQKKKSEKTQQKNQTKTYDRLKTIYKKLRQRGLTKDEEKNQINTEELLINEIQVIHKIEMNEKHTINQKLLEQVKANEMKVKLLQKEVERLSSILQINKNTSQSMISGIIRTQVEQIHKIKVDERKRERERIMSQIQNYVHKKRVQNSKDNSISVKILFEKEEDVCNFIGKLIDESKQKNEKIVEIGERLEKEKQKRKQLQQQLNQIQNIFNPSKKFQTSKIEEGSQQQN